MTDSLQKIVDLMKDAGLPALHSYEKTPPQLPCVTIMLSEVKPRYLLDKKLYATEDIYEMTVWAESESDGYDLLRRAFSVLKELGMHKFGWKNSFDEAAQAYKVHCYVYFYTLFDHIV